MMANFRIIASNTVQLHFATVRFLSVYFYIHILNGLEKEIAIYKSIDNNCN